MNLQKIKSFTIRDLSKIDLGKRKYLAWKQELGTASEEEKQELEKINEEIKEVLGL